MRKTFFNWLALIGLAFFVSACSDKPVLVSLAGSTMGTTYHIKVVPSDKLPDQQLLQAEIDLALEQVNDQMSTYRDDSEISRFNQLSLAQSQEVSADTIKVIKTGIELNQITNGALDITIGPLVNLWGFGPAARPTQVPTAADIQGAKAQTGVGGLSIDGDRLQKHIPELYIDLSSIAKGFGVDKVAAILDKYSVAGYLVEIGGEVSVKGTKADGLPWRLAIEKPAENERAVQMVIEPLDLAVATSGDYRIFYEEDGTRYSHLIDPRSGYPISHQLTSVTVLHPSCMVADGYASAMMVLGTDASLALAKEQNLAVMLIQKQADGFKVHYSDAFKPYVTQQ